MERDYGKDWKEYSIESIPSKNELPNFLYDLLTIEKVTNILDFGCGIGKFSIELYKRGYSVIGVDINEEAIKRANLNGQNIINPNFKNILNFYVGDLNNIELKEHSFDAIIIQLVISIIGGIHERKQLIELASKLLKKDGIIYLSASGVSDEINEKYAEIYKKDYPESGEMYTYFSKDSNGNFLYITHHFTDDELRELFEPYFYNIEIRKEKEASSRRIDEAAYFYYITAKSK